ncbi:autotransporter outer membrane beta-barrel domain-containing protein [uncultured Anaerobiospirillum sp.]|uniref:autotransporter outer membrane beta-barrel domain-containing protein n=1 Tax=uncultured Anaerobiospirillum sp. TaxID=265728 RepID=UPI00280626AF|nr:autotransporter outer membrane beta-barrel domain-containing protein [uncultured Anaerobiospirillum sp.]
MKQTNNAIKFLMAQYRAIFKNANLKMILAATAAAAALSVGSANAATGDGKWDSADFGKANDATNAAETIKSSQDFNASTLPNSEWNYASGESIVTGANTVLNITGAALKHFALEGLTVKEGATLKLTNTDKTNTQIFGYAKGTDAGGDKGTLTVNNGSIELTKGSMLFNTVDIKAGSNITIQGAVDYNATNAPGKKDWAYYANIFAVHDNQDSGSALTVENSTVNLMDKSSIAATKSATLNGSTINFNGTMHADGYSTAFFRGSDATAKLVISNGTVLNAIGDGAIYSKKTEIKDGVASIADGKHLFIDGDWAGGHSGDATKHEAAEITLEKFTTKGTGTLVLGNKTSGGTTTVSGTTVINSKLENHTALTVSGDGILELDAANIKKGTTGLFASEQGKVTLSGGTLSLTNLTETLDLANTEQIKFAGTAAQNVVKVDTSGKIKADNLAISQKIDNAAGLSVEAKNLTLGKDGTDSSDLDLGIGTGTLKAENVTFKSSADKAFSLKNHLILDTMGNGTISGALTIGTDATAGKLSITEGNYTLESGKDLIVKKGSDSNVGLSITNASLTVSGKLATTETNGKINLSEAKLDASKATVDLKAGTVAMTGYSSLVLDGTKVVKLSDTGDLVTFQNGLLADSVTGDNKSKIIFTGMSSMSMEQFKDLKKDASGFEGTWEGFGINGAAADKELAIGNVESGLGGSYYNNTQATVTTAGAIENSYTVGNIKVTDGANATISGGSLTLTNASANGSNGNFIVNKDGNAGGVALKDAGSVLALQNTGTIGAITSAAAGQGVVMIGEAYNNSKTGNVTVSGSIGEKTNVIGELDVSSNSVLTVNGDVYTKEMYTLANSKVNMPNNKLVIGTGSTSGNGSSEIFGDLTAKEIKVEGSGGVVFAGGATVDVATLTGTDEHSFIQVGEDKVGGLGATVLVDKLNLNSGTLFVDPDFNAPASKLVLGQLEGNKLNGKATVGKNAILAIGFDNEEDVKRILSQYLNGNGSFVSGSEVQNALLLNKGIDLGQNDKIIIDPEATAGSSTTGAVAFGKGSALVVTDAAYKTVNGKKEGYAIKLDSNSKNVDASKGGTVILSGKFNAGDKGITIFSGSSITGTVGVQSSNGLINGTIGSTGTIDTLKLEEGKIDSQMAGVSAPVRDLFKKLLGVDGDKYLTGNGVGAELLATIGTDSMTGVEADAAAHAATYAGAQQAAVASVSTMADAMFGRVGAVGVEASSIAATGSQANGGVWVSPMYKNVDADGFNAEGATYGADIDLAGVAFGADTVNGNMRFGAVFNIGSGDADGKGNGSGLKNEFDYYGFGIYSAMGFGNFALVGDASLTVISHDVEGYSGVESFGNLNGKADTTAVTMGLTGQYAFSTPMVDVVPHAGVRFTRLDTESYDLHSAKGVVGTTDFDVQNVFSVPVGVSLSKSLNAGGWLLAPSADLTITFNGGDTEVKSNTKFTGITENVALNTEVLDEVTYGLTLGLGAQYGAFGTSFGINYTGSENTDSLGVNAQARYMF